MIFYFSTGEVGGRDSREQDIWSGVALPQNSCKYLTVVFNNPVDLKSFLWHTDLQWSYKFLKYVVYMYVSVKVHSQIRNTRWSTRCMLFACCCRIAEAHFWGNAWETGLEESVTFLVGLDRDVNLESHGRGSVAVWGPLPDILNLLQCSFYHKSSMLTSQQ